MNNIPIIQYQAEGSFVMLEVHLSNETVWLSLNQLVLLFERDKSVISRHIRNVFKEGELDKISVVANFATTADDGKTYQVDYYNLDVIISVGYRVKSKRGTNFRIWATQVLRKHLITQVNRLKANASYQEKYIELVKAIDAAASTATTKPLAPNEAEGILKVLQTYAYALDTLDRYDHQSLILDTQTVREVQKLDYEEAMGLIDDWRRIQNGTALFGNEKDASFKSSLQSVYQTFDGKDLYPSIEEKAANLLYFIVKNHSFSDGNKRIAAGLFVYFMDKNGLLYRWDGSKRVGDNALVAITIMIAESKPEEKEMMIKLVVNLINENN